MSSNNSDNVTDATLSDDVLRELRGRDQVFSFRLGGESIQRKTLECRAADEIERLRKANRHLTTVKKWHKRRLKILEGEIEKLRAMWSGESA